MSPLPSSSSLILPPSSFRARVAGEFNVLASLRHLNVLQLDALRQFLNTSATNCRRGVKATDYFRGYEERNLVDQPGVQKLARHIRSTFNQQTLNLAFPQLVQNCTEVPPVRSVTDNLDTARHCVSRRCRNGAAGENKHWRFACGLNKL